MCHIPKTVHMMVDANAANGDGVVSCGEVRRSEKIARRQKKEKRKKKRRERNKTKESRQVREMIPISSL